MTTDDAAALEFTAEELAQPITLGGCMILLAMAASVDRRVLANEVAASTWHRLLGATERGYGMRAGDALAALDAHYLASTEVVMPAHLVDLVDDWRGQWVQGGHHGPMPVGGPTPERYLVPGRALVDPETLARPALASVADDDGHRRWPQ